MGHYDGRDLPFYWNLAGEYVLFDRWFAASPGGSVPNRLRVGGRLCPASAVRRSSTGSSGAGISWKFYVQDYDPRQRFRRRPAGHERAGGPRPAALHVPRSSPAAPRSGTSSTWTTTTRTCAAGRCPQVAYIAPAGAQRAPAAAARERTDAGPVARHGPGAQPAVAALGVPVDLRRVGRLVRPRAAAGGPRLPRPGAARERLRAPRRGGQHRPRHAVGPQVHRAQLGRCAPLSRRDAARERHHERLRLRGSPRGRRRSSRRPARTAPGREPRAAGSIYPWYGGGAGCSRSAPHPPGAAGGGAAADAARRPGGRPRCLAAARPPRRTPPTACPP